MFTIFNVLNTVKRPRWIVVSLYIVTAWTMFVLLNLIFIPILVIGIGFTLAKLEYTDISLSIKVFMISIVLLVSGIYSFKFAKWQNTFLNKKPIIRSYAFLGKLFISAVSLMAAPSWLVLNLIIIFFNNQN